MRVKKLISFYEILHFFSILLVHNLLSRWLKECFSVFCVSYVEIQKNGSDWGKDFEDKGIGQLIIPRVADYHALGSGVCLWLEVSVIGNRLTNPFLPSVLKHDFTTRGNENYILTKTGKINNVTTRRICSQEYPSLPHEWWCRNPQHSHWASAMKAGFQIAECSLSSAKR